MSETLLKSGDTVYHPAHPEWGPGTVRQAQLAPLQGKNGQRVEVAFSIAGIKTIHTAVVALEKRDQPTQSKSISQAPSKMARPQMNPMSNSTSNSQGLSKGWLDELENQRPHESNLTELPDNVSDITKSAAQRLAATAELYRFTQDPGQIFLWSVAQSGLQDPLQQYSRVELEQSFLTYSRKRDDHLFDLCRQLRRENNVSAIRKIASETPHRKARELIEKFLR